MNIDTAADTPMTDAPATRQPLQGNLRDRSRAALLDCLGGFARDMGFTEARWVEPFLAAAGECFDELAGLKDRRGFEQAQGLTASRISLVHESDLEFTLELTDLARRLRERCSAELVRLHRHFMVLLQQHNAAVEQTPVGPEAVCRALRALADAVGLDPEQRLRFVERSAEPLGSALRVLYRDLIAQFDSAGLAEKPAQPARRPPPPAAAPATSAAPPVARHPAGDAQTAPPGGANALADLHRQLLARRPGLAPGSDQVALDPALVAGIRQQVLDWLAAQQDNAAPPQLANSELATLLPAHSAAAVAVVECIFDTLAGHEALAPAVAELLGRLRISFLRLALTDPALLDDSAHPARATLDALVALGATLGRDCAGDHALIPTLDILTRQLSTAAEAAAYVDVQAQLKALVDERRRAAAALAPPASELAERAERRENSLLLATRAINALMSADTPAAVRNFLASSWLLLLARLHYTHGDGHAQWRHSVALADRLIRSAYPPADPPGRQSWLQGLPALVRELHLGLAALGLDEAARDKALAPCMTMHGALIAGKPLPAVTPTAPAKAVLSAPVGANGLRILHHLGHAPAAISPHPAATASPGHWLEIDLPEGGSLRGCVVWTGPSQRLLLLADPDTPTVLAATRRALGELAAAQHCRVLDQQGFCERAARQALGRGG